MFDSMYLRLVYLYETKKVYLTNKEGDLAWLEEEYPRRKRGDVWACGHRKC